MNNSELLPDWITVIATVGAVVVAALAIWPAARQVRLAASMDARDSEERTRPYVSVDLVPSVAGPPAIDAVIENCGKSTAGNVQVSLVGREFVALSEGDELGPALGRLFAEGFDLPPGARRRVYWHMPAQSNSVPPGALGAPESAEIVVTYTWEPNGERDPKKYSERLRYSTDDVSRLRPVPKSGSTASGSGIDAQVKNAVHALHAIAEHLGELRR